MESILSPEAYKLYYQSVRSDIFSFLPATAVRLLDIGCAEGVFAAACGERLNCEAWGIENDALAAKAAMTRLNRVLCGDAMELTKTLPTEHFDLITCNDVLEHLIEPEAVLRELHRALSPTGRLVASIPNIRFHKALKTILIDKEFPRRDEGIFDRTHLRFFTRNTIVRMFNDCGYDIKCLKGINPTPSRGFRRFNRLLLNKLEDCLYLQFACVVTPRIGVN